ncbi:protein sax-3-like [Eriocheir sinensis]|uniref:protein sax-3-like n=1 Tax=Eriocheir sinensis TaxID=95602 RepID=UPI0021C9A4AB|nr:protein sax-3-like [Eriocheir sinensis]
MYDKWHKVNGKVESAVVQDGRIQQVGGSLLIRQVTAADAGRYVCVVSSSVGSERAHTSLEVWAPLTAHITPQVQTVDVGGRATFNCSPEGFPQDTITWFKDGEPLQVSERVRLVGQRTLVVEEVKRLDRGMYQCLVSNLEGAAQGSAQLKLGGECEREREGGRGVNEGGRERGTQTQTQPPQLSDPGACGSAGVGCSEGPGWAVSGR